MDFNDQKNDFFSTNVAQATDKYIAKRMAEHPEEFAPKRGTPKKRRKYTKSQARKDIDHWASRSPLFHGRISGFATQLSAEEIARILLTPHFLGEADVKVFAAALVLAGGEFAD